MASARAHRLNSWGRLDILVNNAGILRDKAFHNMPLEDFETVVQVHLLGTVYCIKAARPIMRNQKYGRIVVTTSGSGTVGNFGQSNYGAAKTVVVGLINCLRLEGAKYDILTNAVSPSAHTRMTEGLLAPDMVPDTEPELVFPAVAWLCSEACNVTGQIIAATAGGFARVQYFVTEGVQFDRELTITIEMFAEALAAIADLSTAKPYTGLMGYVERKLREIGRIKYRRHGQIESIRNRRPVLEAAVQTTEADFCQVPEAVGSDRRVHPPAHRRPSPPGPSVVSKPVLLFRTSPVGERGPRSRTARLVSN